MIRTWYNQSAHLCAPHLHHHCLSSQSSRNSPVCEISEKLCSGPSYQPTKSSLTFLSNISGKYLHTSHILSFSDISGPTVDHTRHRDKLFCFTISGNPAITGFCSQDGTHTFTSQSKPLVQINGN